MGYFIKKKKHQKFFLDIACILFFGGGVRTKFLQIKKKKIPEMKIFK